MANTVTITTVNNGPRNLILHVYLKSDGAEGELVDEVIVDPIDFGLPSTTRFAIENIQYNFVGFDAVVEFDTGLVDDKMMWVLGETNDSTDFGFINGLKDRSGLDGTGKIQISTTGFTAVSDQGSMIIAVRK